MHKISKSNLNICQRHLQGGFLVYYRMMTGDTTKLVTIVHFTTSLINQMTCAGGSDIQLVKLGHRLYYLIFLLQNLHVNAEIMEKFTSEI